MQEVPLSLGVIHGGVSLAVEDPLGGEQSLHSNRPAGMDASSADAHFGSQTQAVAVGHPSRAVDEHASRIDGVCEALGRFLVLRDDDVGVAGAELVDVIDGFVVALDELDGAGEVAVLVVELRGQGRTEREATRQVGTAEDLDVVLLQAKANLKKKLKTSM